MIDTITVKGAIGPVKPSHQRYLAHVSFTRFSTTNTGSTTTYMCSPITGAQVEVRYSIENVAGIKTSCLELKMPLASALIGQNYAHAGLDSIRLEATCAGYLASVLLAALDYNFDEVNNFIDTAKTKFLELTWHTETASPKALKNLLKRTENVLETLNSIKGHHDVPISKLHCNKTNGVQGLLAELKSGDKFRQYSKFDQQTSRSNTGKNRYLISAEMKQHKDELLSFIRHHAKNELILGQSTLEEFGLSNPSTWKPNKIESIIDLKWKSLFPNERKANQGKPVLSAEAALTMDRYKNGEGVQLKAELPPYTYTRHRRSIMEAYGIDIATPLRNRPTPSSVGYQLQYHRRIEPRGKLRKLVLCEETASEILIELKRGLAYLQDGLIPDIPDEEILTDWLKRWKRYIERERGIQRSSTNW